MRDRDLASIEQRLGEISRERDVLNAEAAGLVEQRRQLEEDGSVGGIIKALASARRTVIAPEPIKSAEALGDI